MTKAGKGALETSLIYPGKFKKYMTTPARGVQRVIRIETEREEEMRACGDAKAPNSSWKYTWVDAKASYPCLYLTV